MISGANEENLIIATARANIILKLNNTNEYKSWIILDNYIDKLQKENQQLKEQQKEFIKYLESKINKIRLNSNTTTLRAYSKKIIPYIEILSKYKEIIRSDK